jgi:Flp pilus assembly protein protease CpaA
MGTVEIVMFSAMAAAAVIDVRTMRIPNALTFSLMAVGLLTHALGGSLMVGVAGLLGAFAIWYGFAVLGLFAPGDGKLMMGVGAMIGFWEMVEATAASLVLFAPVGFATLAALGRLPNFVAAVRWTAMKALNVPVGDRPEPTKMAHAPLLLVAVAFAHYTTWLEDILW